MEKMVSVGGFILGTVFCFVLLFQAGWGGGGYKVGISP